LRNFIDSLILLARRDALDFKWVQLAVTRPWHGWQDSHELRIYGTISIHRFFAWYFPQNRRDHGGIHA
jgi:hypothetical protein